MTKVRLDRGAAFQLGRQLMATARHIPAEEVDHPFQHRICSQGLRSRNGGSTVEAQPLAVWSEGLLVRGLPVVPAEPHAHRPPGAARWKRQVAAGCTHNKTSGEANWYRACKRSGEG